ncbi:MAG TPA: LamG domain-containing protein [Solirubrobacteraceae bacterium]|jgi:hypothetical protein
MTHWILLAAPLIVASSVMLFAFVGCRLNTQGEGFPGENGDNGEKPPVPETYKSAVLDRPDIVSFWRLSEDPGEATAFDATGTNNGTYVGNVLLGQPGLLASDADAAAVFDGATAHVDLPFVVDVSAAFTLECLVRAQALDGLPTIVSQRDGTGTGRALLFLNASSNFVSNLGGTMRDSGFTAAVDTTYHVVLTFAGGTDGEWAFYVDGAQTATGTATGEAATDGWLIGVNKLGAEFWNGTIDEVAVYNTALDAATIQSHFELASTV